MIVQTANPGQPRFIIRQIDHARACATFARAFGNPAFAPLEPAAEVVFATAQHDAGWEPIDALPGRDPQTGLPWHLGQGPLADRLRANAGSAALAERDNAYVGLLVSQHTWRLWGGQHDGGMVIDPDLDPGARALVEALLRGEAARQARLLAALTGDPLLAPLASPDWRRYNDLRLRFFDRLGLYFHLTHPAARARATFDRVPRSVNDESALTIEPVGNDRYALTPWPFAGNELVFETPGRWLLPLPPDADFAHALRYAPVDTQRAVLTAG